MQMQNQGTYYPNAGLHSMFNTNSNQGTGSGTSLPTGSYMNIPQNQDWSSIAMNNYYYPNYQNYNISSPSTSPSLVSSSSHHNRDFALDETTLDVAAGSPYNQIQSYFNGEQQNFANVQTAYETVQDQTHQRSKTTSLDISAKIQILKETQDEPRGTKRKNVRRSKYRGVFWNSSASCWQTRIMVEGISKHLGFFDDEKEAGIAYDMAALKYRGIGTFVNFKEVSLPLFHSGAIKFIDNNEESVVDLPSRRKRKVADKTTPYKGVCWHKGTQRWKAAISVKGKYTHLGYFDDELEAKDAYERAAKVAKRN